MDLDRVFDALDPSCRGYLTAEQIQKFHEALHFTPIQRQHVDAAIDYVYEDKSTGQIKKEELFEVLQELDRRRQVEEHSRWDFMALDCRASYVLPVKDALMLLRDCHGPEFSMQMWKKFLASRNNEFADVSFEEIKMWLCDRPSGDPCTEEEYDYERRRLDELRDQDNQKNYQHFLLQKDIDGTNARDRENYEEKTKRLTKRKLDRWEKDGVEGLLYDDGIDHGEMVPEKRAKTKLAITAVLDAIDFKYDMLRKRLFTHMLQQNSGEAVWSSMSDSDQTDAIQQIQAEEKQMRKGGSLDTEVTHLTGADVNHPTSLTALMGYVGGAWKERRGKLRDREDELLQEGKNNKEVEEIVQKELKDEYSVPSPCWMHVLDLEKRQNDEKEEILSRIRSPSSAEPTATKMAAEYCWLLRQHLSIQLEEGYETTALAVSLAEMRGPRAEDSSIIEQMRQEYLARNRLKNHRGFMVKNPVDGDLIVNSEKIIENQIAAVLEMVWKHFFEREVMIIMLQSQEGQSSKKSANQKSPEQRNQILTSLRNQRKSWRNSSSEYIISQKAIHQKILQEGIGLFFEDKRGLYPEQQEKDIDALILSLLHEHQDREMADLMLNLHSKKTKELNAIKTHEEQARKEEHLDNVAAVVLGSFETSEDELPVIAALEEKYVALRTLCLLHLVKAEHGLAWERMQEEERQRIFIKKKKEEERLRHDGKMDDLAGVLKLMPRAKLYIPLREDVVRRTHELACFVSLTL